MNFKMWGQALRIIPHVSKAEWEKLDVVSRWLISTRAAVLVMTFLSAAIAGLLACLNGSFDWYRWTLVALGLVFAHSANNLINDFTDSWKGVDKNNYYRAQYGPQPLEHDLLSRHQILTYIVVTGLLAVIPGILLILEQGWPVLWLMLAGAVFVLFYTWPMKYIGLGELAVLIVWGPLMIGGGYFAISGSWNWDVVLASLPYAISVTTVLFGKHIDKYAEDKVKRIFTLPVILGEKPARHTVIALMLLQYTLVLYLVWIQFLSPLMLVILLALPALWNTVSTFSHPKPDRPPQNYPANTWPIWFVGHAFRHNRRWGALFMLGLLLVVLQNKIF